MAQSLLVVSHDFGELANARQWIEGRELECQVMLPTRLGELNAGEFAQAASYATADDLLGALDEHAPEWLLLFTGYLLASQPSVGVAGLRRLLNEAARRGVRIATTDPFLGLIPARVEGLFSNRLAQATRLPAHFRELGHLLEPHDHLYLAPPEGLATRRAEAFFHPAYHGMSGVRSAEDASAEGGGACAEEPYWLFALSSEDGQQQLARWGEAAFCSALHDRIREAHRCQRRTVFVGPPALVHRVQSLLEATNGGTPCPAHEGRDFCCLETFRQLQSHAEHAFYWNPLSNSIVSRLARGQSIFFLDQGHMARSMPTLYDVAVQHYFRGAAIPILQLADSLSLDALAELDREQQRRLAPARDAVLDLPTPAVAFHRMQRKASPHDGPPHERNATVHPGE
jgi:hypothetical protein